MSVLSGHLREGIHNLPNGFYRVRPQVIRVVLQTLERALAATISTVGSARIHEPRFTRQLLLDFERARDDTPFTPRYDITHQSELPIPDTSGSLRLIAGLISGLFFSGKWGGQVTTSVSNLSTLTPVIVIRTEPT